MTLIYKRPFNDTLTSAHLISNGIVPDGGYYNLTLRSDSNFGGGTLYVESSIDTTNGINGTWTQATEMIVAGSPTAQTFLAPVAGVALTQISIGQVLRFNLQGATNPTVYIDLR